MIKERDIQEIFIRSSGPGGQNVNKVSTAVMLRHIPTGLLVKCRKYRTQHQNRVLARQLLDRAVEERSLAARRHAQADRERERRRNRARPQALKDRILETKKKHSMKKLSRRRVAAAVE